MLPILLFRDVLGDDEPEAARRAGFEVVLNRGRVPDGRDVLGRYSVLPYYRELEDDLVCRGSRLLQTFRQHRYVADLGNWVAHLGGLTPATWNRLEDVPGGEPGPFVIKGATNSRKDRWRTHMFAADRAALREVWWRVHEDTFLEQQGLYVRRFERLRVYLEGANGQPITNEWRVFVLGGRIVEAGYYWSSHDDETRALRPAELPDEARALVEEAARRVGDNALFFTVDVAEREAGGWLVVELNDGQMAGLSTIPAERFYERLRAALTPGLRGR